MLMFVKLNVLSWYRNNVFVGMVERRFNVKTFQNYGDPISMLYPEVDGAKTVVEIGPYDFFYIKESPEHLDRLIKEALKC
jgi:hypothetical protein